jgi:hypothetical protein
VSLSPYDENFFKKLESGIAFLPRRILHEFRQVVVCLMRCEADRKKKEGTTENPSI